MLGLSSLVVFLLGLILGSFANVVVYRRGTGKGLGGRSRCLSCSRNLGALDLVPVLSWVALGGRCRSCGSKVSWQYPLVELAMGVSFLAAFWDALRVAPWGGVGLVAAFVTAAAVAFFWVAIAAYDSRHMAMPDSWSYAAAAIALSHAALWWCGSLACGTSLLVALLAGPAVAAPLFLLWLVSSGRWLGLGDAKLALSVGWLLGLSGGFLALFLAVLAGAVSGVAWVLWSSSRRGRAVTMKAAMPFGPFIVLGALGVLWTGATFGDLLVAVGSLYGA